MRDQEFGKESTAHLKSLIGGKTVPENLQMLCRLCNGLKSDR